MYAGLSLSTLTVQSHCLPQVAKADLYAGDSLIVKTCNSLYFIRVLGGGAYRVSGGWFDRKGLSPMELSITGCTWGGSAVKVDSVAACGLSVEFGNRLKTSPVTFICLIPFFSQN